MIEVKLAFCLTLFGSMVCIVGYLTSCCFWGSILMAIENG